MAVHRPLSPIHISKAKKTMLATKREWTGLAVLGLPTLLISIDVSVMYLALPEIGQSLGTTAIEQLWMLDIYSFLLAGCLITMGNLGDRIGRRRLLFIGAAAFAVASVAAAFAATPEQLIGARALLGIAGATLAPSTMALIRNMFTDPRQMQTAIGVWFACFMGGVLVGPIIGGLLLEHFWWGSVFLLAVPVMLTLLITGPFLLPEYRSAEPGRLDLVSVGLSLAALLPVIWGIKEFARGQVNIDGVLACALGITVGVLFVKRQGRLASPLLDLRIFRSRLFTSSLAIIMLAGIVMAGLSLVAAIFLQSVLNLSPMTAGLWLIPQSVLMLAGFQVAPLLALRLPTTTVAVLGLAVATLGLLIVGTLPLHPSAGLLVAGLCLASFGVAFPMALLSALMLSDVDPERAGAAAAVNETSGELGIAVGVATLGGLATWVYAWTLGSLEPGAPGGASASLEAALGYDDEGLGAAAREAFTIAVSVVGLAGALAFVLTAAFAVRMLKPATASAHLDEAGVAAT